MNYALPAGVYTQPFKDGTGSWAWYKGAPIRSVSKILNKVWPMPADLDPWYLTRGQMVHSATVMVDAGTLDWKSLDSRIQPFVQAYQDFINAAHPIIEASELTVVHPSCKYGARLDRVYRFPGRDRLVVGDIKTGIGRDDRYWCQVAGCAIALDEDHVSDFDLALINLDKDGRPHYTQAEDPGRWIERFRQILQDDAA